MRTMFVRLIRKAWFAEMLSNKRMERRILAIKIKAQGIAYGDLQIVPYSSVDREDLLYKLYKMRPTISGKVKPKYVRTFWTFDEAERFALEEILKVTCPVHKVTPL
jgi:hypothetical protein